MLERFLRRRKEERTSEEIERNQKRRRAAARLADEIRQCGQEFPYPIIKIILFGGVAKKADRSDSDIDIAVVFDGVYHLDQSAGGVKSEEWLNRIANWVAREEFGNDFRILPFHVTCVGRGLFESLKNLSVVIKAIHQDGIDL